ncbi:MAG TPA: lysophospholipid acyltransferase family protein [Acidimicrobiia bacterium]|nr:lysophospholipid acyltransferase family protein [Acidimicrobiia bacterium]
MTGPADDGSSPGFYRFARALITGGCRLLFGVRVTGRENVPASGVYIVAPSHRSLLDIPIAAGITPRRIRFMAKESLFKTRLGAWLFGMLGAIRVERGTTDRAALRASQAALEAGEPLAIFPEGTRRQGPVLGELYNGAAYVALKLGVPIVPVGIGGSEQILATQKVFPRLHRVRVVVGEPLRPAAAAGTVKRSEVAALTEELRQRLQKCFDEARAQAGVE